AIRTKPPPVTKSLALFASLPAGLLSARIFFLTIEIYVSANRKRDIAMRPNDLPIFELENEIVEAFQRDRRVILQAPTGSGKTTQVPQFLIDSGAAGDGEVVVLQPRRLAARLLACRVAAERGCRPGDEVGYQIRFDNVTSSRT